MTAAAAEIQTRNLDTCLAMLRTLDLMASRPLIVWRCLCIRIRMRILISDIRSINFAGEGGRAHLRQVHAGCAELNRQCVSLDGRLDRLSSWLLAEPFARLADLCEDLDLAVDDEAHDLIRKIAAAIA
ncbi:MAG: hypothetical protein LBU06_09580 [Desulfovibrio sp.]|jgi:hypothetical protein|nr:hypothetical protein [Desulfovibrio sp.]